MATQRNNSVIRAFEILCCFTLEQNELSAADIAGYTGMHVSTVHRFLLTLETLGAVVRTQNGRFQLGMLLADLGGRVFQHRVLSDTVQPFVDELVFLFRETVHVAVLEKGMATYIAKGESPRSLQIDTRVGKNLHAYCSGVGKVLLGRCTPQELQHYFSTTHFEALTSKTITDIHSFRQEIQKVREQGYAIDDEENEEGLRCVAVPIFNEMGEIQASISVSGPITRLDWDTIEVCKNELTKRAELIKAKLYRDLQENT